MATQNEQKYEFWGKIITDESDDTIIVADDIEFTGDDGNKITWTPTFALSGQVDADGYQKEEKVRVFKISNEDGTTSKYLRKKKLL